MSASAHAVVADLRDRIRQFDGRALGDRAVLPFGVPEIDERLPGGGLALASLVPAVRDVMTIFGFDNILALAADRPAALALLK